MRLSLFVYFITVFLVLPLVTQAALLPTPTGSCPTINGVQLVCQLGKCATAEGASAPGYELPCNYTLDDILQSGVNFVNLILGVLGALALLVFVYGGFNMLTSMGNPETIKKGKDTLTGGFIGLILILGAAIFVWFAGGLLGAKVGPTGQVSPGVAECGGKADDEPCGEKKERKCYKQVCVTACDYYAATNKACLGFSCQPKSVGLLCAAGHCPGEASYQCCISQTMVDQLKKPIKDGGAGITEAGTCPGVQKIIKEAEEAITPSSEQGCCAETTGNCKSVKDPGQCKEPSVFYADLCANVPECFQ